jgi:hypothetical protein
METQNSQQHATRPYSEPDESTPRPSYLLPSGFPTKRLYAFLVSPTMPPASPTSSPEISLTNEPSRLNGFLVEKLAVAEYFKKVQAIYESQKLISISKLTVNNCTCP